jgi:Formamidopyrimidine-DNA glycosylase N-terminal domain
MPELPEVESARLVIEQTALGHRIVDVDDTDVYVCRPHLPGEIRTALRGRRLVHSGSGPNQGSSVKLARRRIIWQHPRQPAFQPALQDRHSKC